MLELGWEGRAIRAAPDAGAWEGTAKEGKERNHLPDDMNIIKLNPKPNQYYDVMLEGALVGTSEHRDTWSRREYWLFTDIEGTQKRFAEGHHYEGAAWLKGEYQDEAGPPAVPLATGGGFDPDSKRRKAIEDRAVERIMAEFPQPSYEVCHVGNQWPRPGYDIRVICPDGSEWHIEAKGTRSKDAFLRVQITEGERVHPEDCPAPVHALCVVTGIRAEPDGEGFRCSGGTPEWVWPWKVTEKPGDLNLLPDAYRYVVPSGRHHRPPPLAGQ